MGYITFGANRPGFERKRPWGETYSGRNVWKLSHLPQQEWTLSCFSSLCESSWLSSHPQWNQRLQSSHHTALSVLATTLLHSLHFSNSSFSILFFAAMPIFYLSLIFHRSPVLTIFFLPKVLCAQNTTTSNSTKDHSSASTRPTRGHGMRPATRLHKEK